jgi:replicative DNA helicase
MLAVLEDAVQSLGAAGADVALVMSRVEAKLSATTGPDAGVKSLEELVADLVAAAGRQTVASAGIETGLSSFDQATGGLHPGELVIVAARPSVGKSALAATIGLNASLASHRVLFVSLEMTGRDIAARMLAGESGESFAAIRSGAAEPRKLESASSAFVGLPFRIWSGRKLTTERLRAVSRLEQSRDGLDVIIVDYIGLIEPADRRKPRWEAVTEISSDLKSLALSLQVPVIALCQLNRDAEGEQPKLSHLRESGAIEQDADIVALLHRDRDSSEATLNIAKIRNGKPGAIDLRFDQRGTRFSEPTVEQHAGYDEHLAGWNG